MTIMDSKVEPSLSTGVRKRSYLEELKEELKKVSWTTKEELILCTKIVVGATFFLGMGIYLIDLTIKGALNLISYLVRLMGA